MRVEVTNKIDLFDGNGILKTMDAVERMMICTALAYTDGCVLQAAHALGISRTTIYRRIEDYAINVRAFQQYPSTMRAGLAVHTLEDEAVKHLRQVKKKSENTAKARLNKTQQEQASWGRELFN
jgi:predicted DNA-binding transcriptional regulator AlpA